MPKDSMLTKEDLEKEKQKQQEILKEANEAAAALQRKKKAFEELKQLEQKVLTMEAHISTVEGRLSAVSEERQRLEEETGSNKTEETAKEVESDEKATKEASPEPDLAVAESAPEPKKEKKLKTKSERREENRRKNAKDKNKTAKEQQKVIEVREKVLANMGEKPNEKGIVSPDQEIQESKEEAGETLEQKTEFLSLTGEDINLISRKIKGKLYLSPEERAMYEKNPQLFDAAVKTKSRSLMSYMTQGYLWLQKKFFVTPKTEKIVLKDEEMADTSENIPAPENKKQEEPKENKISKKEQKKADKERMQEEFIKKVSEKIKSELEKSKNLTNQEKGILALDIYKQEKEIFEKEKRENAGLRSEIIERANVWWRNLSPTSKAMLSSSLVASTVVGVGLATGNVQTIASAGSNFAKRVAISSGLASALSSNRMGNILKSYNFKDEASLKKVKQIISVAGIGTALIYGGWTVGAIAAGGYGIRKGVNYILEKKAKKNIEYKVQANEKITSADFNDGFDISKLQETLREVDTAYTSIMKREQNLKYLKGASNYLISSTAGIATMMATHPDITHAQENHSPNETPAQKETTPDDSHSSTTPPNSSNETTPAPTPKDDFMEVKTGEGVTQTLKHLVEAHKVPDWVSKELGNNPTAKDYANFAEKYGMYHPNDAGDSIMVSKGDSFGFNDKGDLIWRHAGQDFNVVKVDSHGHHEEGDWLDKMQDEKFIHSGTHTPPEVTEPQNTTPENENGGPTIIDEKTGSTSETKEHTGPTETKSEPNTPQTNGPSPEAQGGSNHTETNIPKTDTNPYQLNPEQLEYTKKVYESILNELFKDAPALKYWHDIQNSNVFQIIDQVKPALLEDENARHLAEYVQKIHEVTKLEPYHPTLEQPLMANESIENYIVRGLQYATANNKLNQLSL